MDMWTSNQNKGYMCVTIHWIDDTWSIQKRIIRFMHLEGSHTGSNMADELVSSLIRWFIEKKMFSLSLDNAAANEVCVNSVITQLKNHGPLVCDGSFFHVRCVNHILNLVARDGLHQIGDGVSNIRTFVLTVNSSPPLFEDFNKCAAECGLEKSAGLPLDVQTRWNSTYKMLREALIYRKAFQRLYELDKKKFEKFVPSAADWENALQLCRCLKKFDDLTVLFSGNSYPIANLFYKGFCEVKVLITQWSTSRNEIIKNMACSMKTKFNKYWDKSNIALVVAFFLDPRYKKNGIEYYMKKVYGELLYPAKVEELMIAVKKMYASYEPSRSASHHTSNSSNNVEATELLDDEEKDEYYESLQGNMVDEDGTIASDLDKYMYEPPTILPTRTTFNKFDVLSWWKTNHEVYPTLCKLARDVLAIQVSTVALESAFSAGGRVIDPYCSRLDREIVEALIYTKDWVAARKGNKKPGSILKDIDVVETLVANMNLEDLLEDKAKQMTVGASESDDDGASPAHGSHKDGEEDASYDAAMSYA